MGERCDLLHLRSELQDIDEQGDLLKHDSRWDAAHTDCSKMPTMVAGCRAASGRSPASPRGATKISWLSGTCSRMREPEETQASRESSPSTVLPRRPPHNVHEGLSVEPTLGHGEAHRAAKQVTRHQAAGRRSLADAQPLSRQLLRQRGDVRSAARAAQQRGPRWRGCRRPRRRRPRRRRRRRRRKRRRRRRGRHVRATRLRTGDLVRRLARRPPPRLPRRLAEPQRQPPSARRDEEVV